MLMFLLCKNEDHILETIVTLPERRIHWWLMRWLPSRKPHLDLKHKEDICLAYLINPSWHTLAAEGDYSWYLKITNLSSYIFYGLWRFVWTRPQSYTILYSNFGFQNFWCSYTISTIFRDMGRLFVVRYESPSPVLYA
jgi:hypothetical protein